MDLLDLREPVSAWTHGAGLLLSIPGAWLLWRRAVGDRPKQVSLLIYGLSLAACFGASATFHGARRSPEEIEALATLDRLGIFLLIAGSYTPIAWNLLRGRWRTGTLVFAWGSASAGCGLQLAWGSPPVWVSTAFYLAMGWGAIFCYTELTRALSRRTMRPILAGGQLYSAGALLNLLGWPVLVEGWFGAHEVFHLFVLAAGFCHFRFMWRVVAPAATEGTAGPIPNRPRLATGPIAGLRGPLLGSGRGLKRRSAL